MLKKPFQKAKLAAAFITNWFNTINALKRMKNSSDKEIALMASSIGKRFSPDETSLIEKIKKVRETYSKSKQEINLVDYGAGKPNSNRSENEMNQGVTAKTIVAKIYLSASTPEKWGKLLFCLIREFKPENCLELGTSLGISALYQLSAMQLNQTGRFSSIEGSPEISAIARQMIEQSGFEQFTLYTGRFADVLPIYLNDNQNIDFVFIDGHHDGNATKSYFDQIYPNLSQKALVIFDDINWSEGMNRFWKSMCKDNRLKACFDLFKWGIVLIDKSITNWQPGIYRLYI